MRLENPGIPTSEGCGTTCASRPDARLREVWGEITNAAYRRLCAEQGAGLYVCEMITSRGLVEADFVKIGEFLKRAADICINIVKEHGKLMKDWNKGLVDNKDMAALRADVEAFAEAFAMPGFDATGL